MADGTLIGWTDATWTVVQGCDPVSPGCAHCYVPKELWRMAHNPDPKIAAPLQGLAEKHMTRTGGKLRFTGKVVLREDRLDWPRRWREPRNIFVPSHGDLFHKDVPDAFIDRVFAEMQACPRHTFQVLTKRQDRMRSYVATPGRSFGIGIKAFDRTSFAIRWPLPNVILGVSVEDEARADERRPALAALAAAGWATFVSYEPSLGPVDWTGWEFLDGLISGGESGQDSRPSHPQWHRAARDFCDRNGIAYFFKQWGDWVPVCALDDEAIDRLYHPAPEAHPEATRRCRVDELVLHADGSQHRNTEPGAWLHGSGAMLMFAAGKARAGNLLDGVKHEALPDLRERPRVRAHAGGAIDPGSTSGAGARP